MLFDLQPETVYRQGTGPHNEDALVSDDAAGLHAVIDGATGLGGLPGRLAADAIEAALHAADPLAPLPDMVACANQAIADAAHARTGRHPDDMAGQERAAAGFVLVRQSDGQPNRLEYAHAGDCMLFTLQKDATLRVVTIDHIARLDRLALAAMSDAQGIPDDRWDAVLSTLRAHRDLVNTPDGFGLLDGTTDALDYVEYGSVPLIQCAAYLLITDGLFNGALPMGYEDSWRATARQIFAAGLVRYTDDLEDNETHRRHLRRSSRLKTSDDKAGVLRPMEWPPVD